MDFKITLAAARVNAGFTQAEIARKIGVSCTTVKNWENGRSVPKMNQFQAFCNICKVPMEFIFLPDT